MTLSIGFAESGKDQDFQFENADPLLLGFDVFRNERVNGAENLAALDREATARKLLLECRASFLGKVKEPV
jgi:hypothetical protein